MNGWKRRPMGLPFYFISFINYSDNHFKLKSIELLYYFLLCNGLLTCLFVIMGKQFKVSYTNIMVTRKVGSYVLTIIILSLICVFTMGQYKFVEITLYVVNVIILIFLVIYFKILISRKL